MVDEDNVRRGLRALGAETSVSPVPAVLLSGPARNHRRDLAWVLATAAGVTAVAVIASHIGGSHHATPLPFAAGTETPVGSDSPVASDSPSGVPTPVGPSVVDSPSPSPTSVGRCHTSDLGLDGFTQEGAAGTIYVTVRLRNTSAQACSVYGFPGMQRLDSSGQPVATTVHREGAAAMHVIVPGALTSYLFHYSHVCPAQPHYSTKMEITPPDEKAFLTADITMDPCDPDGNITTGPMRAS